MSGKCVCKRCGNVTPVENSDKTFSCKYCERCRTTEEIMMDLGCDCCNPKNPLCLAAPSAIECPRAVF